VHPLLTPQVVAAMCFLVDHPAADTAALRRFMPAPDFPTGGEILDDSNRELKQV
jgi:DNA gyrase/topoisomerase IV subunit A